MKPIICEMKDNHLKSFNKLPSRALLRDGGG